MVCPAHNPTGVVDCATHHLVEILIHKKKLSDRYWGGIYQLKNKLLNKNKREKQNIKLQTRLLLTHKSKHQVLKIVPIRPLRY